MRKHKIPVPRSPEDQVLVRKVPELPACVAQGGRQERALADNHLAKPGPFDRAREPGDLEPEPMGERLMLA